MLTRTVKDRIYLGSFRRAPFSRERHPWPASVSHTRKRVQAGNRSAAPSGFCVNYAVAPPARCLHHRSYDMSRSFRRGSVVWLLVLASACATPASPTEMPEAPAAERRSSALATTIVQLTNAERSKRRPPALRASQPADAGRAAPRRSDGASGPPRTRPVRRAISAPEDRLAAAGYQWSSYAENIAMGQSRPPRRWTRGCTPPVTAPTS